MIDKTNLVLANKSVSLRTTIPASLVRQFNLSTDHYIEWDLIVIDEELKIIITPKRKE